MSISRAQQTFLYHNLILLLENYESTSELSEQILRSKGFGPQKWSQSKTADGNLVAVFGFAAEERRNTRSTSSSCSQIVSFILL